MFFAREEIAFPADLNEALTKALWKGPATPDALSLRARSLEQLWEKLARKRGMAAAGETHYSFLRQEAEAYASYYLPCNALKPALVLEEAFLLGLDLLKEEAVWLDLGTGPGTALWGTAWWCARREKQLKFIGLDQSTVFTEIASRLAMDLPFSYRSSFQPSLKGDPAQLVRKYAPTHLSFVNSLAEYFPDPEKRAVECARLLQTLAELSRKDGRARYLLVIEPGSRESSRELAELKDTLQSKNLGQVLLPCLDSRKCGALANPKDWCHEEVACRFPAWVNELGAGAGMRKESMLFSYLLMRAGAAGTMQEGMRVVSQRLERKGQVECWLCTNEGKKYVRAQRSKAGPESKAVLEACRGDIWKSANVGPKGDLVEARLALPTEKSLFS